MKKKGNGANGRSRKRYFSGGRKEDEGENSTNPFELRWARRKHKVVGVQGRHATDGGGGEVMRVGESRARAEQKRRGTLAVEMRESRKSNVFADRRIGEGDDTVNEADRYWARFQRERSKRGRVRRNFNLEADDDDDGDDSHFDGPGGGATHLTHGGRPLDEFDGFSVGEAESEEDGERNEASKQLETDMVDKFHFGGGFVRKVRDDQNSDQENKPKTHSQIMAEIVAKSKIYKASFDHSARAAHFGLKDEDEYDKMFRALANEKRSAAADRMKTEEEMEMEERARLEKLEQQRLRRLQGIEQGTAPKEQRRGGDDLDDGFDLPHEPDTDDQLNQDDTDQFHDADDDALGALDDRKGTINKKGLVKIFPQVNDVDVETKPRISSQPEDLTSSEARVGSKRNVPQGSIDLDGPAPASEICSDDEISFTYAKIPETYDQLLNLLVERTPRQRALIIHRIRKCFPPSLRSTTTKPSLRNLLRLLCRRISKCSEFESFLGVEEIDALLPEVYALGQDAEEVVSGWARSCLQRVAELRSDGILLLNDILLFRAIAVLYPSTDLRHPIVSPLLILLARSLVEEKQISLRSVIVSFVGCSLLHSILRDAHRCSGELVSFLTSILTSTCPASTKVSIPAFSRWRLLQGQLQSAEVEQQAVEPFRMMELSRVDDSATSREIAELKLAIQTVRLLTDIVSVVLRPFDIEAIEPFLQPIWSSATTVRDNHRLPARLRKECDQLCAIISELRCSPDLAPPLQLYQSRPKAPKLLNPRFDDDGRVGRKKQGISEEDELRKLKRRVRKEERSAIRELQRDEQFISRELRQEQEMKDQYGETKRKEAMAFLENQERTWKEQVKKKQRLSNKW
mmetsp:Transcript_2659/g.4795  ORF Transcript_2659/g.4795 Transcript_2659/m.4795 type:complete len:857 (+) Transcript_2659:214-2784(+)